MNITVEKQPNCHARLSVEVPSETVSSERKNIIKSFSQQARLPGFRPGKAPKAMIEKRYAKEIGEELESRLVRQGFQEAIKKESLKVLDAPSPDETVHNPDGTFTFSTNLTLAPDFELPDYKSIVLEIPDRKVEDEDIDMELEQLRARFADVKDITDRALQEGDFAIIDYKSTFEDKPLAEAVENAPSQLVEGTDFWLKMDDESFLPGFSSQLEGASTGDSRSISVMIEEDHPVEELRGKDLHFDVTIKSIKIQELPELTDEFAASVVPEQNLEGLKGLVREQLEQHIQRQLSDFKTNQLLEKLTQQVDFELPEALVANETQNQADQLVEQGVGSGMSEDDIATQEQEIFDAAGQRARMNLKSDFLLQEIATKEEIKVDPQEMHSRIAAYAQQAGKPVKSFAKELQRNGRINGLHHQMLLGKTIDFLLDQVTVESVASDAAAPADTESKDDE